MVCRLTVGEIEERVELLAVLPTLQSQGPQFVARLQRYVWPTLDGRQHDALLYYFKLVAGCSAPEAKAATTHVTLLKKMTSLAQGVLSNTSFWRSRCSLQ